jgi:hypothetical protein
MDNKKIRGMWQSRWWCVQLVCLIIIYVIFLEIIDNEKIEKSDYADDDVYNCMLRYML